MSLDGKLNELYQKYLKEKLDSIFDNESGIPQENKLHIVLSNGDASNRMPEKNEHNTDDWPPFSRFGEEIEIFEDRSPKYHPPEPYYGKNIYDRDGHSYSRREFVVMHGFCNGFAKILMKGKFYFIDEYGKIISREGFDDAVGFWNGYGMVKKNGKWNILDMDGKPFSPVWFDDCVWVNRDYIEITNNGKMNLLDGNGRFVSSKWFDQIEKFHNGFAIVKNDDKWNLMDRHGELISSDWFESIEFINGTYTAVSSDGTQGIVDKSGRWVTYEKYVELYGPIIVEEGGKHNFRDHNANLISSRWFDDVFPFKDGYAMVVDYIDHKRQYNFIDMQGQLISSGLWFDEAFDFHEGYARVNINGGWIFINEQGQLISSERFDEVCDFHEGYARVKRNDRWNFISSQGNVISIPWFNQVEDFHEGYAKAKFNNDWCFIDGQGKRLNSAWFDDVRNFHDGFAAVMKNGKWNFINDQGQLISSEQFDWVDDFRGGYARVKLNNTLNVIDSQGKLLFSNGFDANAKIFSYYIPKYGWLLVKNPFSGTMIIVNTDGKILLDSKNYPELSAEEFVHIAKYYCVSDLKGATVKEGPFGDYAYMNNGINCKLSAKPIKSYGLRYVLCTNMRDVYMYDCFSKKNTFLGKCLDIVYDNNFIINKKTRKVYLMHENEMTDITDYYMAHLADKDEIKITRGIGKIHTRDEFASYSLFEAHALAEEEKEKDRKAKIVASKEKENEEISREIKELELKGKEEKKKEREERKALLEEYNSILKRLERIDDDMDERRSERAPDNLFIAVDTHLEINPLYIKSLRYINLEHVSFDNVKVAGVDFRGCNMTLDPQKVFEKDLSGCNFDKFFISPFLIFTGVDIRGCTFSADDNPRTTDTFNPTFKHAIYDENTTYNGVSFVKIFSESTGSGRDKK